MLRCIIGSAVAGGMLVYCKSPHNYLHLWGNGNYNPRPGHSDDLLNFSNFFPKLIRYFSNETGPNLIKLVFGPYKEAGIDDKGKIYIWNKHILNNVRLEEIDDEHRDVKPLNLTEKAVQLVFTNKILFALDNKGNVWQWRFDLTEDPEPRKIPTLSNIHKIASGSGHFLALDKNGDVWSMGDDTYGQCGIDKLARQISPPYLELKYPNPTKVLMIPEKVVDIACGKNHSLALLETGEVWGWGRNDKLQLSSIDEKLGKAPAPVSFIPTRINGLSGMKVIKLAAGDMFSIFITDNNGDTEAYGCGLNRHGQLGLGYLTHVTDVIKIQNISNFVINDATKNQIRPVGITDVQCGFEHCLALMDVGAVYSWGGNEYGEQGNKKRTIQEKPFILKRYKNKKIISIAAGEKNSGVIWTE
jgi:alpha-tubulin suppressor-like RCC1 family protein